MFVAGIQSLGIQSLLVYLTKGVSATIKGQVLSSTSLVCVCGGGGGIGACMHVSQVTGPSLYLCVYVCVCVGIGACMLVCEW